MTYKEQLKTVTSARKDEVVAAAAELFLAEGIEPVAMTDIARRCEMGVASLYRYFGTKASLVIEAGGLLWKRVEDAFRPVWETEEFKQKSGAEQLAALLALFPELLASHRPFLRFTYAFDQYSISGNTASSSLSPYEKNILKFYPRFQESYQKGCADGTLKKGLDEKTVYFAITHALFSLCQKALCGTVLVSDTIPSAETQLNWLTHMVLDFLETEPTQTVSEAKAATA